MSETNFDDGWRNVVFIEGEQRLEKLHVSEHLLGGTPVVLDFASCRCVVNST